MNAMHIGPEHSLSRLIATINSTTKASEIVHQAVDALAMATGSHAALVYGWDEAQTALVLQAAAPGEWPAHYPCELRLGEGVVGMVALTGEISLAPAAPIGGPLHAALPGAAPLPFILAVPIVARADHILGVLCLVHDEPGASCPNTIALAADTARLLAVAIEHGQLRESARKSCQLLEVIALLAESAAQESTLASVLDSAVSLGLRLTLGSVCAIYLRERSHAKLRLAAVSPGDSPLPADWPEELEASWRRSPANAHPLGSAQTTPEHFPSLQSQGYRSTLLAPIALGSERFGLLVALDRRPRRYPREDAELFERLAQVTALAIHHRQLLDTVSRRTDASDLMWEILSPGSTPAAVTAARILRLGCDLGQPRVVLVAGPAPRATVERLRQRIRELDRSALHDVADDRLTAIVIGRVLSELPVEGVSIGASNVCSTPALYCEAYREAREALEVGGKIFGEGRLIRYEELGSYRFVPALVQSGLARDFEYQQVARLPDDLLMTLEAYLECGGNTVQAAQQLFLHRNTMRQRLDKVAALLDLDPTDPKRWLYLQLAIKAVRMARIATPAPVSPTSSARALRPAI